MKAVGPEFKGVSGSVLVVSSFPFRVWKLCAFVAQDLQFPFGTEDRKLATGNAVFLGRPNFLYWSSVSGLVSWGITSEFYEEAQAVLGQNLPMFGYQDVWAPQKPNMSQDTGHKTQFESWTAVRHGFPFS